VFDPDPETVPVAVELEVVSELESIPDSLKVEAVAALN
jgi:hypothetical protein